LDYTSVSPPQSSDAFLSSRACGVLVVACLLRLAPPLGAQQQTAPAAWNAPGTPLNATLAPPAALDRPAGLRVAANKRPVWLFSVVGAAAGALIGLAVPDGCDEHDCTLSIPPALLGAVYGGAIGLVIEIAL
jgi:hypothetical protein